MKTIREILKSLKLVKCSNTIPIAQKYIAFLGLINEIKNDIEEVNVLKFEKLIDPNNKLSFNLDFYFELEFIKTVQIKTSFGTYNISVPINTNFYSYLCVLLNIQSNCKKEVLKVDFENTIFIDNNALNSINKAAKFTNLKDYKNLLHNVYLKFENNKINILSTNGFLLYKSESFDFISDKKFDNLILSIPVAEVDNFKTSKNEFLKIDIINDNEILVNDFSVKLVKIDISQFDKFCFEVGEKMEFSKVDFQKNIKSLKPMLDFKNSIKFHLNGSIEMQPITENQNKTSLKMNYESKNFTDTDYIFGFKNIDSILSSFKSKNLFLIPKIMNQKSLALITDNKDSFILMSQM